MIVRLARQLRRARLRQSGFTLIELLVVIAILAILAGVVVFSVSGIGTRGESAAYAVDARTLRTAEEAYRARFGSYGTEDQLVDNGFLREPSAYHDIEFWEPGRYTIVSDDGYGGAPLPQDRQVLTVGFGADPWPSAMKRFPRFSLDAGVVEMLTRLGDDYSVQPSLATHWELVNPGTNPAYPGMPTWRFHLRPGVKLHNGADFTADDVVWSMGRVVANNDDFSATLGAASTVKVDSLTVDITSKVTTNVRLPESFVHPNYGIYANGTNPMTLPATTATVVGTGPFRFKEYVANDRIVVERNEGYWGTRAKLARITFKFIPDSTSRRLALESGAIDAMFDVGRQQVAGLRSNPGVQVVSAAPSYVFIVYINVNGVAPYDKLTNENVRRALALSLNRGEFVEQNWEPGVATVVNSVGPPSQLGEYASLVSGYTYDLAQARALLDAEGWTCGGGAPGANTPCAGDEIRQKAGVPLHLYMLSNRATDDVPLLEDLQARARVAGIDIEIGNDGAQRWTPRKDQGLWDLDTYVPNQNDANPAFLLIRQWWYKSTVNHVSCWGVDPVDGQPCPTVSSPWAGPWQQAGQAYDALVNQALAAPTFAEAQYYSARAMDYLVDHVVTIPVAGVSRTYGLRDGVEGFEPVNPAQSFVSWSRVYRTR